MEDRNLKLASKYFKAARDHNTQADDLELRNDFDNAAKYRKWAKAEHKAALKYSKKIEKGEER